MKNKTSEKYFSQQLKKIMFKKNLTQKELSDLIGINRPLISRWLTGVREPSLKAMKNLSKIFDVPLNFFLENSGTLSTGNINTGDNSFNTNPVAKIELLEEKNKRLELELELIKNRLEKLEKKK